MNKNRVLFLFVLVGLWSIALLTGGRFIYFMAVSVLILYIGAYLSLQWNSKQLYMFFYTSEAVLTAGEIFWMEYKLSNMSMLPLAYGKVTFVVSKRLGELPLPTETIYLGPYQMLSIRKSMICKNRGFYTVGNLLVEIEDPFKLFKRELRFDKTIELTVYPKIYPIDRFHYDGQNPFGQIITDIQTADDFTNIRNIRKYQSGDSLKNMHWKLFARLDIPFVKEFNVSANPRLHIYLDGFEEDIAQDSMALQDGLVEVVASLVHYGLKNQISLALTANTEKVAFVEGTDLGHIELFLKYLTSYMATGKEPFDVFIKNQVAKLHSGATVVAVTTQLNSNLFRTLIDLNQKNMNIVLVVFHPNEACDEKESYLNEQGIVTYRIDKRESIGSDLEVSPLEANQFG